MDVIKVKNLSKSFKIYRDKSTTLKEKVLHIKSKSYKEMEILKDINLSVSKGEMLALIGHNGSGKSTLLKLLTKIIYPDKGQIEMSGRVSSLLELGAGFHPDFTGVENIYMNASIFGLSRKEISTKVDDIVAFSELGDFLYNPVRTYSSGMYMRLAFAIAINIEPDILLVDEVLAVGDASFQRKCLNRIKELKKSGKTIVLVTHDHGVVEKLCDRAIWLHSGRVKKDGHPKDVVNDYLMYLADKDQALEQQEFKGQDKTQSDESLGDNQADSIISGKRWGNGKVKVIGVEVESGNSSKHIFTESKVVLKIKYEFYENLKSNSEIVFGIAIHNIDKVRVYGTNTLIESINTRSIPAKGILNVEFPTINLIEGDYIIDIAVHDDTDEMFDYFSEAAEIRVLSKMHDVGYCRIPHLWSFEEADE